MRPLVTAALALALLSQAAYADESSGSYVGAGAGQLSIQDVGGSSTSSKAFVGANFGRFLGFEAGYIDGGTASASVYDPSTGVSTYGTEAARAAQFSVLGRVPLSPFLSLFGRVGGIYWRDDENVTAYDYLGNAYGGSASITGTSFEWGGGGEAAFGHFALRAEFEQATINSYTYRLVSGSLIYHF